MIVCKELNKRFSNKQDMFKALKENKQEIISLKLKSIQKSADKGLGIKVKSVDVTKLVHTTKGIITDDNYYYIAVNTTRVLDSHSDLHMDGIWNKTVKEQQGKNYLVLDHDLSVSSVVAKKENVEMFIAEIPFSSIGKSYEGNTQALIYKIAKGDIINPLAKDWLESGSDIEASVRMQYVKMDLAMNSEDADDVEELKNYNDNVSSIANKSEFAELDYFWIVTEAKNIGESSLVLNGSNSATGVIEDIEPSIDTQKGEPSNDTQIDYEYLINNINK